MGLQIPDVRERQKTAASQLASRQIRRFLQDAQTAIAAAGQTEKLAEYGLEQAVSDRIQQISGTPADGRLSLQAHLDLLLTQAEQVVLQAKTLPEEDLTQDVVTGMSVGVGGIDTYLSDALKSLTGSMGSVVPADLSDRLGSQAFGMTSGFGLEDLA